MSIPGGAFWMGSAEGEGEADERPQRRVTLSAFCIDRTEVTVAAYRACVGAGGCTPAPSTVNVSNYSPEDARFWSQFCNAGRDDVDSHPINCVDWAQADGYCRWRGGSLPTEAQWEYAARGSDGRRYPWGNGAPGPTRLNAIGAEANRGLSPLGRTFHARMYDGDDGYPFTAPVGSYPAGASPFGLQDMAGNVCEWVADWYGAYDSTSAVNPVGPQSAQYRVNRAGSWIFSIPTDVRASRRFRDAVAERHHFLGFRCARAAP